MAWTCPNCGLHIPAEVVLPVHCICERRRVEAGGDPAWVLALKEKRAPEDKGVGDTFARLVAPMGGDLIKSWSAKLGIPCGCTRRQAEWNERWPY